MRIAITKVFAFRTGAPGKAATVTGRFRVGLQVSKTGGDVIVLTIKGFHWADAETGLYTATVAGAGCGCRISEVFQTDGKRDGETVGMP